MADETTTSEATTAASTEATAAATTGTETTQATETAATTTAAAPPAWSDLLRVIQDEKAREFFARYDSLEAAAKGGLDLRRMSSQRDGWVKLPGANATDEEKTAWRKAMGIPEGPEAYGVALPEDMAKDDPDAADRFGRFLKAMHETGGSKEQVAKAVEWYISENRTIAAREAEARIAADQRDEQILRREYGADFDARVAGGARAAQYFGGPDYVKAMEDAGLGNNPHVIRAWAKVAAMTAESVPAIAQPRQQSVGDLEALKAEKREREDKGTVYDPDFQRRWAEGFRKVYGTAA